MPDWDLNHFFNDKKTKEHITRAKLYIKLKKRRIKRLLKKTSKEQKQGIALLIISSIVFIYIITSIFTN